MHVSDVVVNGSTRSVPIRPTQLHWFIDLTTCKYLSKQAALLLVTNKSLTVPKRVLTTHWDA